MAASSATSSTRSLGQVQLSARAIHISRRPFSAANRATSARDDPQPDLRPAAVDYQREVERPPGQHAPSHRCHADAQHVRRRSTPRWPRTRSFPSIREFGEAPKPSWAGFSNGVHRFYLSSAKHNVEDEPQLRNFPHLSRQQSRHQHLRFHLLLWLLADQHKHLRFHKPHTTSVQWRGELSKRSTIRIRYGTVAQLVVLRLKAALQAAPLRRIPARQAAAAPTSKRYRAVVSSNGSGKVSMA